MDLVQPERAAWCKFKSDLGWMGLLGCGSRVSALTLGHASPVQVRQHLARHADLSSDAREHDFSPALRERLQCYASGERVDFADIEIETHELTPFRRAVVAALRQIPYGSTLSYAELAEMAGSPRAARAVGSTMAANRVPLIVPCHRVVAAGGNLGGFSAPSGLTMKQRLLQLEQVTDIKFAVPRSVAAL